MMIRENRVIAKDSANLTFNLERMRKAVEAPRHTMPQNLTREELREWLLAFPETISPPPTTNNLTNQ